MFQIDISKTKLVKRLTYAGTLPLLFCTFAVLVPVRGIDAMRVALCYGAIIVSFLCGVQWAVFLLLGDRCRRNLLLYSNAIALAAWLALLITPRCLAFCMLGLCFLALLKLDLELSANGVYPAWYARLRINATIIVMLNLFLPIGYS
jgi:hypothetical protein